MAEAGEIVIVAGAFVAGICTASCLPDSPAVMSIPALTVPFLFLYCVWSKGRCVLPIALIFFLLGALRWNCDVFWSPPDAGRPVRELGAKALQKFTVLIERAGFGEGTEALVKAMLSGRRDALGKETLNVFRASGASHILALSGLHLGIIYLLLSKALSPMGHSPAARTARSVTVICSCAFYTLMTGASPSTVRALLFITMNETARSLSGRRHRAASTFCAVIVLQLLADPKAMMSTGFQLSYLAMTGLMTVYPALESWYPHSGDPQKTRLDIMHRIWSSASMAIACQAFTAPLVWLRFHTFPRHFLLTNIMALPLTEATMTSAVVTIVLTALKICPGFMPSLTGRLAGWLEYCLFVISGM